MLRLLFDASNICLKFIIKLRFEIEKRRKWKKGIRAPLNPLSAQPTSRVGPIPWCPERPARVPHCHVRLIRQDCPTPHKDSNRTDRHSQVTRELRELVRIHHRVVGIRFLVTICISELPLILSNQNPRENPITIVERRPVASIEEAPDRHHRRSPILSVFVR